MVHPIQLNGPVVGLDVSALTASHARRFYPAGTHPPFGLMRQHQKPEQIPQDRPVGPML
ncbi:MAG: hypothetical protein K0Q43_229 [Ramlibacter sp.]|jgi:hypothetical protein|nr:hypothetical protein [Ramlibacter sp.]